MDISEISKTDKFSYSQKGSTWSWNKDKVKELLTQLKAEDDGSVRVIPLSWVWTNLRNSQTPVVWTGWQTRQVLLNTAIELGYSVDISTSGCVKSDITKGSIQLKFK